MCRFSSAEILVSSWAQLMAKISADENLHMIFYRDVSEAGFDLAPNKAMKSLHKILRNFQMPGFQVPEFRRKAVAIAVGGVYDPRIHLDEVVMPILKKWRIFEREDFTGKSAELRDDLALLVKELEAACDKFEVSKQRQLDREARTGKKVTAHELASNRWQAGDEPPVARHCASGRSRSPARLCWPRWRV